VTLETDLAKLEAAVLKGAPAAFVAKVEDIKRRVALGAPTLELERLARSLVPPKVEAALVKAARLAGLAGVNSALALVDEAKRSAKVAPSKAVRKLIKGLDKSGIKATASSRALIAAKADPDIFLAPLYGHANAIKARATDVVNRAGNEGVTAIADGRGASTVWVAETNACVVCLAYSGVVTKPGKAFPGGLTYGRKSYFPEGVETPPRHPNCRCTVELLVDPKYADALRREADRSVLRGFSLESESMGTRIDAADRLVEKGVSAPKSVIAFSKRSVKAGKFPTRGR